MILKIDNALEQFLKTNNATLEVGGIESRVAGVALALVQPRGGSSAKIQIWDNEDQAFRDIAAEDLPAGYVTSGAATVGTLTVNDTTTPSITFASGKTNTGYVLINGKTSGSTKYITADATGQAVTVSTAAQTVGAATVTIPDLANVNSTFSLCSTATLTAGATPAFTPKANISTYLLTPAEDETIAATTTGAVAGKSYHIRVLTSGTSSYTLTFGSNFKSTGTLATGVTSAKTFVVSFLFDGTNFVETGRTVAM